MLDEVRERELRSFSEHRDNASGFCYKRAVLDFHAEERRVASEFEALLERAGVSARAASAELGHHPSHLRRLFRGQFELKVRDAFGILWMLNVSPGAFFEWLYPLGGAAHRAALRNPQIAARLDPSLARLRRRVETETGENRLKPAERTARLSAALTKLLRRKKVTQPSVSRMLGLPPNQLGEALRGRNNLTFIHVFGVLSAAGTTPGRFFLEHFLPPTNALAALRFSRLLDDLERGFPTMMEGLLVERASEGGGGELPGGGSAGALGPDQTRV